jgi:hypothetical protein
MVGMTAISTRLVAAADFADAADHPGVLHTERQASRRRPSPAYWEGGREGIELF